MIIRQVTVNDAQKLSELATETYAAAFGHSFTPSDLASHLERNLSPSNFECILSEDIVLVAEAEGRMAGFVQFGKANISLVTALDNDQELHRLTFIPIPE